jgi:hypothetical protein
MAATDTHAKTELEAVFIVRSMPRLYNEDQLQVRQSPTSKHVNIEAEEAVTRQQLVKIQQTEKTSYVLQ